MPSGSRGSTKQLKLANARSARFAIVIGPDDRARGEVAIKDLASKTQVSLAPAAAVDHVKGALRSGNGTRG